MTNRSIPLPSRAPWMLAWLLWLACAVLALPAPAYAQPEDPPGRVGRLSELQGRAWLYDTEQGQWVEAYRNRALTTGDRLSTERSGRAEIRIGSTEIRLDGDSELELLRIDDERMVFQLHSGSAALRVRSRELADEVEFRTAEGRAVPERSGSFRIDRDDDTTFVTAWRGSVRFDTHDLQVQVPAGRRAEFFQQSGDRATVVSWSSTEQDAFAAWVTSDEQRDDRSASQRYVSPEMTGAEDLDRYGRWERHPEFGMVWSPLVVSAGWAPYRHGRWSWSVRWGWTWVDEAPWGFAPFHYGRWVNWGGRWSWTPGAYVARPAFAPALVAWVGGPSLSFSVQIGGGSVPAVGWLPLAPRDVYVPPFRYGPRYYRHVNQPQYPKGPPQVPTGPIMYGNHGVPNAVTVVPSNVLVQRQPVGPAVVRPGEGPRLPPNLAFRTESPAVPAPRPVLQGTAQPVGRHPGWTADTDQRRVDRRRESATPVAPPPAAVGPARPATGNVVQTPGGSTRGPAWVQGPPVPAQRVERNEREQDARPAAGPQRAPVFTAPPAAVTGPVQPHSGPTVAPQRPVEPQGGTRPGFQQPMGPQPPAARPAPPMATQPPAAPLATQPAPQPMAPVQRNVPSAAPPPAREAGRSPQREPEVRERQGNGRERDNDRDSRNGGRDRQNVQ